MVKLSLSVDDRVVSRAKHYAKRQGGFVSQMVEAYLDAVAEPAPANVRDARSTVAQRGAQEGRCRRIQSTLKGETVKLYRVTVHELS